MVTLANVEACLDDLARRVPDLFSRSLLIGGWSALLYYRVLAERNDPAFPPPIPDNPDRLQSKDIDFTNVWKGDYFDALPQLIVEPVGRAAYLEVRGVRIGFAQAPEAIDPAEAFSKSRKFRTSVGTKFAVLDPIRLYRGKQAMIEKGRGKANDAFHLAIAGTFARSELADAKRRSRANPTNRNRAKVGKLVEEMKSLAPELLR